MKAESLFVLVIGMLTLAVLASGCASTKPSEDFFSAAGFNVMPANMPGRLAHLKALPPHQVTTVVRNGKTYLAYPDAKQKVLYVGTRPGSTSIRTCGPRIKWRRKRLRRRR